MMEKPVESFVGSSKLGTKSQQNRLQVFMEDDICFFIQKKNEFAEFARSFLTNDVGFLCSAVVFELKETVQKSTHNTPPPKPPPLAFLVMPEYCSEMH